MFILFSSVVDAQFKKGMKMPGITLGSIVFNSGTSDITVAQIGTATSRITGYNVNISPSLGWFISDDNVVGGLININPYSTKTTYEANGSTFESDKTTNFNIGLGAFFRHYFHAKSSMIPFTQIGLNGGIANLKTEGFFYGGSGATAYKDTYTGDSNGGSYLNSTVQLGMTKMFGDAAGLDIYIGYNFSYNKNTFKKTTNHDDGNNGTIDSRSENNTTTKFTNHGFVLGVGFQVFLKGKK